MPPHRSSHRAPTRPRTTRSRTRAGWAAALGAPAAGPTAIRTGLWASGSALAISATALVALAPSTHGAPASDAGPWARGQLAAAAPARAEPVPPRAGHAVRWSPPARADRSGRTALRPERFVRRDVASGPAFSGVASWYGPRFEGRTTANGEVFDPDRLTAASRTLPMGTRLRVCRADRCVVVRVNDRGPYVDGRVLDLSRAARDRLGGFDLARVTATPVRRRTVPVPVRVVPDRAVRGREVTRPVRLQAPARRPAPPAPGSLAAGPAAGSAAPPLLGGVLAGGALLAGASGLAWARRSRAQVSP